MGKVAGWAALIVVLAAAGSALDSTSPDTTVPTRTDPPIITSTEPSTVPESTTTSTSVGARGGKVPTRPKKSPHTTAAPEDEIDCNDWEDYADSGEYDVEDIADICGLDDEEITDWENE